MYGLKVIPLPQQESRGAQLEKYRLPEATV
jgi:hypothetical protein